MRSFGKMLLAQRQKLGLTQKQVANLVRVSDAYICSLEGDKKSPPPYHTVAAIAGALQLDPENLWKVAVKHREQQAVERSKRKLSIPEGKDSEKAANGFPLQNIASAVPDSQINAFFKRPEIQMAVLGLFQKQIAEMTAEEKRVVYQAINSVGKLILGRTDEATGH